MSDNKRTCGDCAWWQRIEGIYSGVCNGPTDITMVADDEPECEVFRSHEDQSLIDECHKLRSLGAAVEWSKIDRLVEIASGRELDRVKRCATCKGIGHSGVIALNENGNPVTWVDCEACHGTGYQKGGER